VLESFLPPGALTAVCAAVRETYWEAAVQLGVCTDAELIELLGDRLRVRPADLSRPSPQARDLVPEALARRYRVLPLAATSATLDVATSDPGDLDAERALSFAAGRRVRFRLAAPSAIAAALDALYQSDDALERAMAALHAAPTADDAGRLLSARVAESPLDRATTRPVIRLVDLIIAEGIAERASDVHLEPEEGGIAVRYRVDGVLRPGRALPRAVGLPLVSRVKIMAGMDGRGAAEVGGSCRVQSGNRAGLPTSASDSADSVPGSRTQFGHTFHQGFTNPLTPRVRRLNFCASLTISLFFFCSCFFSIAPFSKRRREFLRALRRTRAICRFISGRSFRLRTAIIFRLKILRSRARNFPIRSSPIF
jgi:hypothetical protein